MTAAEKGPSAASGSAHPPATHGSASRPGGAVVLIGMPGVGKSTVGVLLAKQLGLGFVDTDIMIQERAALRLQQIVDSGGYRELRRHEEEAILALEAGRVVIATGGSAVYSERSMRHLRALGSIVYLRAHLELLAARIDDYERRGIANPGGQRFDEIYHERTPLYERYAGAVVTVDGLTHDEVVRAVIAALGGDIPESPPLNIS